MRIALDAMGGDHAPYEVVKGAVEAFFEQGVELVLVGREAILRSELKRWSNTQSGISIVGANDVFRSCDSPAVAVRNRKELSIVVAMNLLKEGEASALVSAGNSGAVMTAALLNLGMLKGFDRPALGALFPTPAGAVLIIDVGANVDCKPKFLVQFAQMGNVYMERVFGIESPRIGLLSNGEEDGKGNELTREAHKLLTKTNLNFIGNVEGNDISTGVAEVIVTDGFTGNVLIKVSEGFSEIAGVSYR